MCLSKDEQREMRVAHMVRQIDQSGLSIEEIQRRLWREIENYDPRTRQAYCPDYIRALGTVLRIANGEGELK